MELLNVVDVEATCWEGAAPPGQISEIVEIGLAVVDLAKGERVGRHRIVVRPTRSTVSPFCTELTGLTQAEVDGGVNLAAACRTAGTAYPFGHRHTNAKAVFATAHRLRNRPGMAEALRIADLPLEGRHHRGEDDAWNIAALILSLNNHGHWPNPA